LKFQKNGKVVRGVGGLYEVRIDENERLLVRAKGVLKQDAGKVLIGDNVTVIGDDAVPDDIVISAIAPRQNALIRPPMANLDMLFAVFAVEKPEPALETVDKLLSIAVYNKITPVVVLTKTDLSETLTDTYRQIYEKAGFRVFVTCAKKGENEGVNALKAFIEEHLSNGKTAAFAGASGVGKSTLLNAVFPGLSLATGNISARIERGKHTTRTVELFECEKGSAATGFLADTPGFSLLDFEHFDFFALDDLLDTFPDIARYRGKCRYVDCAHVGEGAAECAVAKAEADGTLSPSRLSSYRSLYKTLKNKNNY